jgi:predicted N-acetyltransferase YhbS
MTTIRHEQASDTAAREALLDRAMGKIKRRRKTSERLRAGRLPAEGLAFVAADGERVVGTVRLWNIACESGEAALLLGPMAVAPDCRNCGIGGALVRHAVAEARRLGHRAVILVGDAPYYSRFGFAADKMAAIQLPGPVERHRLLALELAPGALDSAQGMLRPAGAGSGLAAPQERSKDRRPVTIRERRSFAAEIRI